MHGRAGGKGNTSGGLTRLSGGSVLRTIQSRLILSAALILGLSAAVIVATSSQFEKNRTEAKQAASAYSYYADVNPDCRFFADQEVRAECVAKQEAAAYQEQYNQADLQAQKDMATWAFGLFWVGILGFVTSAGSIVFLYMNLIALEKQTDETRRIGQDQTKAYLAPVSCVLKWTGVAQPWLEIAYKNGGQTPAVKLREVVCFVRDEKPPSWNGDEGIPRPLISGGKRRTYSGKVSQLRFNESRDPKIHDLRYVWVYIFYQDVFGRLYRSGVRFHGHGLEPGVSDALSIDVNDDEILFEEAPEDFQPGRYSVRRKGLTEVGDDEPILRPTVIGEEQQ